MASTAPFRDLSLPSKAEIEKRINAALQQAEDKLGLKPPFREQNNFFPDNPGDFPDIDAESVKLLDFDVPQSVGVELTTKLSPNVQANFSLVAPYYPFGTLTYASNPSAFSNRPSEKSFSPGAQLGYQITANADYDKTVQLSYGHKLSPFWRVLLLSNSPKGDPSSTELTGGVWYDSSKTSIQIQATNDGNTIGGSALRTVSKNWAVGGQFIYSTLTQHSTYSLGTRFYNQNPSSPFSLTSAVAFSPNPSNPFARLTVTSSIYSSIIPGEFVAAIRGTQQLQGSREYDVGVGMEWNLKPRTNLPITLNARASASGDRALLAVAETSWGDFSLGFTRERGRVTGGLMYEFNFNK